MMLDGKDGEKLVQAAWIAFVVALVAILVVWPLVCYGVVQLILWLVK